MHTNAVNRRAEVALDVSLQLLVGSLYQEGYILPFIKGLFDMIAVPEEVDDNLIDGIHPLDESLSKAVGELIIGVAEDSVVYCILNLIVFEPIDDFTTLVWAQCADAKAEVHVLL